MPESEHRAGFRLQSTGVLRKADGTLIAVVTSDAKPPEPINCVRFSCLKQFIHASWLYTLQMLYDKYRLEYVMKHRNDDIDMKYRTGEGLPQSIKGAIKEIIKLKLRR